MPPGSQRPVSRGDTFTGAVNAAKALAPRSSGGTTTSGTTAMIRSECFSEVQVRCSTRGRRAIYSTSAFNDRRREHQVAAPATPRSCAGFGGPRSVDRDTGHDRSDVKTQNSERLRRALQINVEL